MVVPVDCVVGPVAQALLQAVDGQRGQRHQQRGGQAGRDGQPPAQQVLGQGPSQQHVQQGYHQDAPTAQQFPAQGHEQGHGADGHGPAEIVEQVRQLETRLVFPPLAQEGPQAPDLFGVEDAALGSGVEIGSDDAHGPDSGVEGVTLAQSTRGRDHRLGLN